MACDGDQSSSETSCRIIYQECLRECHIAAFTRVQGFKCNEFRPSGERNSLETVWCSNCGCYIKHHRKVEYLVPPPLATSAAQALPQRQYSPASIHCHAGQNADSASSGVAEEEEDQLEEGGISMGEIRKKRRRLTEEEKQKVMDYAKTVNWSVRKQDEGKMLEFCADIGISTEVCRNWINNHRKKINGASSTDPTTSLHL